MSIQNKYNHVNEINQTQQIRGTSISQLQKSSHQNISRIQSGFVRQISNNEKKRLHYTPHQNKFYGYCQFPAQRLNEQALTESRFEVLKSNSLISSEKMCEKRKSELTTKISEFCFEKNPSYLSGSIVDVKQNIEKSQTPDYIFRLGCKTLFHKVNLKQTNQSSRFVCKYINHRQIQSPQINLINKYLKFNEQEKLQQEQYQETERSKITISQDRERLTINDSNENQTNRSFSKSLYQTLDISMQMNTINSFIQDTKFKTSYQEIQRNNDSQQVKELYQSYGKQNNHNLQLINVQDQMEQANKLQIEFSLYPKKKLNKKQCYQPIRFNKISTEAELCNKEKDYNVNYLL